MNQFQQLAYCIYDHLGNTRVNFTPILGTDVNGNCELQDVVNFAADYYPYACIEQSFNSKILRQYEQVPEKYITTQHERDEETGLDYRGARFYDSDIARFLSLDPLAAKFPSLSTYNYVIGNPLKFVDPDGKAPVGDYYDVNGKYLYSDGKNDRKVYEVLYTRSYSSDMTDVVKPIIRKVGKIRRWKLEYSGKMEDDLLGNGHLTLKAELYNGKVYTRAKYTAVAGGFGNGAPENGNYEVHSIQNRGPSGWYNRGMTKDGFGFSLNLDPTFKTERTDLRIHPDGKKRGTQGCIGMSCSVAQLKSFYKIMTDILTLFSKINMNINITGNPNNDGSKKSNNNEGSGE